MVILTLQCPLFCFAVYLLFWCGALCNLCKIMFVCGGCQQTTTCNIYSYSYCPWLLLVVACAASEQLE
jgi:hypothetical protein